MQKALLLDVHERPKNFFNWFVLSLQHVMGMFGATVLVPILTGLDIGVALVASGLGTLVYILCTKGKVPIYLGSSFAYIAAIIYAINQHGVASAFFGLLVVGLIYVIVAIIIRFVGSEWVQKLLPPVVIGPVIIIIGLTLAPVAVEQAGLDGNGSWQTPLIAFVTFASTVAIGLSGHKFLKIIPFLLAIIIGYVFAAILGVVSFIEVFEGVRIFALPEFQILGTYSPNFNMVLLFAPIAFVTIAEHIGDHTVLGEITQKDFIKDPGLDRTLLGDGLATMLSASLGGPANTSYGENTGIVAMSRVGSVFVIGGAALIAVILGFFGPLRALMESVPGGVIGGITIILYGLIAANGIKVLVRHKVDLGQMRNLVIVAAVLVIGLGGAFIEINHVSSISGMSLAAVVGIILNVVLPKSLD